ncbi:MAG: MFS transporter [Actinomycetota bacterium]
MGTPTAKSSLWSPLASSQFRLLLASDAISNFGDWLYNIVFLVFVFERTHSAARVGAASIVRTLPEILLSTLGGVVADHYDRRVVMIASNAGRAALMLALALVSITSAPIAVALVIVFCSTALGTPYVAAGMAAIPAVVAEDQFAAANALVQGWGYVSLALGPALGRLLILFSSASVVFALNGLSFVVGVILVRFLRPQPPSRGEGRSGSGARLGAGLRAITSSPEVAAMVALIPILTFIPGSSFVLLVLVAKDLIHTGPQGVTFLFTAIGAGGVLGTWASKQLVDRGRVGAVLMATTVATGASFGALALVTEPIAAYALCALTGAWVIVFEVISITVVQRLLAPDVVGRVFGVMNTLIYSGILVGSLLAPVLVAAWGLKPALVAAAVVPIVLVAALSPKLRAAGGRSQEVSRPSNRRLPSSRASVFSPVLPVTHWSCCLAL